MLSSQKSDSAADWLADLFRLPLGVLVFNYWGMRCLNGASAVPLPPTTKLCTGKGPHARPFLTGEHAVQYANL
jgi:hypothetical protein